MTRGGRTVLVLVAPLLAFAAAGAGAAAGDRVLIAVAVVVAAVQLVWAVAAWSDRAGPWVTVVAAGVGVGGSLVWLASPRFALTAAFAAALLLWLSSAASSAAIAATRWPDGTGLVVRRRLLGAEGTTALVAPLALWAAAISLDLHPERGALGRCALLLVALPAFAAVLVALAPGPRWYLPLLLQVVAVGVSIRSHHRIDALLLAGLAVVLVPWTRAVVRTRSLPRSTSAVLVATAVAALLTTPAAAIASVSLAALVRWIDRGPRWWADLAAVVRQRWCWPLLLVVWVAAAALVGGYWRLLGAALPDLWARPPVLLIQALPVVAVLLVLGPQDVRFERGAAASVPAVRLPARALALVLVVVIGAAAAATVTQWQRNDDPDLTDQGAYVAYAIALRDRPSETVEDRNRMPAYPYLVSRVIRSDDRADGFDAAKAVGVAIAVVGSALLLVWLVRRLGWLGGATGWSLFVLSVVMFKAAFAQADLAVFFLLLAAAVCCWRVLRHPTALGGAVAGLILGLTQLTKANASIMLLLLLVVGAAAAVVPGSWSGLSPAARRAMPFALVAAVGLFVAVLAPYAANSQRRFGDPLYNTNSRYYLWYDSWPEAMDGWRQHEFPEAGAPAPEPVPSGARYFDHHDLGDVVDRVRDGLATEYQQAVRSYGFFNLLGLTVVAGGAALVAGSARSLRRMRVPLAFGGLVVGAYLVFTAWWTPLAQGERFLLLMFLPVLAMSLLAIDRGGRGAWLVWRGRSIELSTALFLVVLGVVVLQIPALLHAAHQVSGGL